jgi:DNA-binding response OmpR family regulator
VSTVADAPTGPHIAVIADDLIWASRLVAAVQQAGATSVRMGTDRDVELAFEAVLLDEPDESDPDAPPRLVGAIVDLFGHRYDGVEAVRLATAAGLPVVAVAQHDDIETRKLALEAGALRVFSYAKLFQDGPALVRRWFVEAPADDATDDTAEDVADASDRA